MYECWLISVEIVQLSDQELINDGFMGDGELLRHCVGLSSLTAPPVGAPESVRHTIEMARAHPELFDGVSLSFFLPLSHLPLFC